MAEVRCCRGYLESPGSLACRTAARKKEVELKARLVLVLLVDFTYQRNGKSYGKCFMHLLSYSHGTRMRFARISAECTLVKLCIYNSRPAYRADSPLDAISSQISRVGFQQFSFTELTTFACGPERTKTTTDPRTQKCLQHPHHLMSCHHALPRLPWDQAICCCIGSRDRADDVYFL